MKTIKLTLRKVIVMLLIVLPLTLPLKAYAVDLEGNDHIAVIFQDLCVGCGACVGIADDYVEIFGNVAQFKDNTPPMPLDVARECAAACLTTAFVVCRK